MSYHTLYHTLCHTLTIIIHLKFVIFLTTKGAFNVYFYKFFVNFLSILLTFFVSANIMVIIFHLEG